MRTAAALWTIIEETTGIGIGEGMVAERGTGIEVETGIGIGIGIDIGEIVEITAIEILVVTTTTTAALTTTIIHTKIKTTLVNDTDIDS